MSKSGILTQLLAVFLTLALFTGTANTWASKTDNSILNITLPLKDAPGGSVNLKNGKQVTRLTETGSSRFSASIEKVEITKWRGSKVAALILAYDFGGSGTFKRLYFLTFKNSSWEPKAWYDLGDRTKVRYLSLYRHGAIYLGLIAHKKDDPACCPTKRILRIFHVTDSGLRPAGTFSVDLFPDEISCDTNLIDKSAHLELIPEVSFSPHGMGAASPIPTHVGLVVNNKTIVMRVINAQKYIEMWMKEKDPAINIAINRLKRALEKKASSLSPPFDILPPRPGVNDFAIFISHIPFKNGQGLGFVGRVTKDVTCISSSQLRFFYMGLDKKGNYLVTISKRVEPAKDLPSDLWLCSGGISGLQKQIKKLNDFFRTMTDEKAFPELVNLKRFIKGLEIKKR